MIEAEEVRRRLDTMSALNRLDIGPESEAVTYLLELGDVIEHFSELKWIFEHDGAEVLTRLISSTNVTVQTTTVKMLARSLRLLAGDSVPQEVLNLMQTVLEFFKTHLIDKRERNHLAEPLFEAMEDAGNTSLVEVKYLLRTVFPLSVLESVDYSKMTPEGREVATNVVLNYFKTAAREPSESPFRAVPVFAKICLNPNINCATVDYITEQVHNHLQPEEQREERLKIVARTDLVKRLTEHVLDVEVTCDGSCIPGLMKLGSLVFTAAEDVTVMYLTQGILDIISLALLDPTSIETKRYAIMTIGHLVLDGEVARNAMVKHHLLWSLLDLLRSPEEDLRNDARSGLARFAELADADEVLRAMDGEMCCKFRDILRNGLPRTVFYGLETLDKFLQRVLPGGLDVDLRDELRRSGVHLCVSKLRSSVHAAVKAEAIKVSSYLN